MFDDLSPKARENLKKQVLQAASRIDPEEDMQEAFRREFGPHEWSMAVFHLSQCVAEEWLVMLVKAAHLNVTIVTTATVEKPDQEVIPTPTAEVFIPVEEPASALEVVSAQVPQTVSAVLEQIQHKPEVPANSDELAKRFPHLLVRKNLARKQAEVLSVPDGQPEILMGVDQSNLNALQRIQNENRRAITPVPIALTSVASAAE